MGHCSQLSTRGSSPTQALFGNVSLCQLFACASSVGREFSMQQHVVVLCCGAEKRRRAEYPLVIQHSPLCKLLYS